MYILDVTDGPRKGERIKLREAKPVIFGRNPAAPFAVPADITMSGKHFSAVGNGDICMVTDEGSSNGTYVDGVRIVAQQVIPGQRIRAGSWNFRWLSTSPANRSSRARHCRRRSFRPCSR
ncbi:MAG: FHA domain-containing protein [Bryobacterales bacterium]|nr:FHA domain-containing protein [Bryobacterales bacterium]